MPPVTHQNATVMLFDPVIANMHAARASLVELGLREIESASSFRVLAERIAEDTPDLIIAELATDEGDVSNLIKHMRASETGTNAFAVCVLTTWRHDAEKLRIAIDSGADDVLLRPFSVGALAARVSTLIHGRKEFIVTGDYIGPDRRKSSGRASTVRYIEAPNTLKAAVSGDIAELQVCEQAIVEAAKAVDRERVRWLSVRVATAAKLRLDAGEDADVHGLNEMRRAARELLQRLRSRGCAEATELASTLVDVANRLGGPDECDIEPLKLARDLALGAYAAYAGEDEGERSRIEVDRVAAAVRARIATQAATAHG